MKPDEFRTLISDHIPAHHVPGSVTDSSCELKIKYYDGSAENPKAWLEIFLTENYSLIGTGRNYSKSTILTVENDQLKELLKFLKNIC